MDRESFTEEREWTGGRIYINGHMYQVHPALRYTQPTELVLGWAAEDKGFRTPWRTCQLANKPENFGGAPRSYTLSSSPTLLSPECTSSGQPSPLWNILPPSWGAEDSLGRSKALGQKTRVYIQVCPLRAALSMKVATSHRWLFKFTLI